MRSMYPLPVCPIVTTSIGAALPSNNTTANVGAVMLPSPITVNKILYNVSGAGNAADVVRIVIYSEDGQTKYYDVTDAVGAATGVRTIDVTDLQLDAGNYYSLIGHGTYLTTPVSVTVWRYDTTLNAHIAGEPDLSGTLTVAAMTTTAPATIDPTALTTVASEKIPVIRLLGT